MLPPSLTAWIAVIVRCAGHGGMCGRTGPGAEFAARSGNDARAAAGGDLCASGHLRDGIERLATAQAVAKW